jgi:hypothetical protein
MLWSESQGVIDASGNVGPVPTRLPDDEQIILAATDVGRYCPGNALVDVLEKAIEGSVHEWLPLPLGRQFDPQVPKPLSDLCSHAKLNGSLCRLGVPFLPSGLRCRGHTVGLMFALSRKKFVGS